MEEMNTRKILLLGASGFVGARAAEKYRTATVVPSELIKRADDGLFRFILEHDPDIILNCAAISDIGTCEKNPDASYLANVTLPLLLARAANDTRAKFVSFSSDQVYTGCNNEGPYDETMPLPEPTNVYARHKLEAEKRVLDINPNSVLLRATWMYDMPMYNHKNRGNFLVNTLAAISRREKMSFSPYYFRGLTYVRQVVDLLDRMFAVAGGVYNYGSENPLDMYETARALFSALGLSDLYGELVQKNSTHPHNLWMSCNKLRQNEIYFYTTEEGFARCIGDYKL